MKKIYFIRRVFIAIPVLLFAFVFPVKSQITLTQASYATWALGLDSTRSISGISVTPANNGVWDLSSGTFGTTINSYTRTAVSGNATYPSATYSYPNTYSFNPLLSYQTTAMHGLGAAGVMGYGDVVARQAVGLISLTGGINDSLVFNQQNIVNSTPEKILAFPATAGSSWNSGFMWDLSFNITVAAFSLNKTPGVKRAYTTILDSVKGWGKMRVQNVAGQTTAYMDVLAVKTAFQQKDSFFLNGAPAPAAIVTAFGLTQGQISAQYYISYFRAGELQPLLTVVYSDNTFSTPTSSTVHAARLALPTASVPGFNAQSRVRAFPNPVSNGMLQIEIANAAGTSYSYEIMTIEGQKISAGTLNVNKGTAGIHIDQPSGTYFLRVMDGGQSIGLQQIQVRQ